MPRPEQLVPQAPQGADQGAQTAIQGLAAASPLDKQNEQPISPEGANVQPQLPVSPQFAGEMNDGYDPALFAQTDRPNEPITHGAPFGPGASFVPMPAEDNFTFLNRVADELSTSPDAGALAPYISEIRKGR
jgi:hypothetical protein